MKRYNIFLAVVALVLGSLACQTMTGGSDINESETLPPAGDTDNIPAATPEPEDDLNFSSNNDSEFPMPDDAKNVVNVTGIVNYQTSLSLDEVMSFYRDFYGKQGLSERELLTTVSDGVFSFVFDGHESGQAIVIQGVDLGDGSVNVNISLQDI
jgi:hypothetical protein